MALSQAEWHQDLDCVLPLVFTHLAPRSLIRCSMVCGEWRGSSSTPSLWQQHLWRITMPMHELRDDTPARIELRNDLLQLAISENDSSALPLALFRTTGEHLQRRDQLLQERVARDIWLFREQKIWQFMLVSLGSVATVVLVTGLDRLLSSWMSSPVQLPSKKTQPPNSSRDEDDNYWDIDDDDDNSMVGVIMFVIAGVMSLIGAATALRYPFRELGRLILTQLTKRRLLLAADESATQVFVGGASVVALVSGGCGVFSRITYRHFCDRKNSNRDAQVRSRWRWFNNQYGRAQMEVTKQKFNAMIKQFTDLKADPWLASKIVEHPWLADVIFKT